MLSGMVVRFQIVILSEVVVREGGRLRTKDPYSLLRLSHEGTISAEPRVPLFFIILFV